METNLDGLVAIRHYNSNPSSVSINGNSYTFIPKFGISLAWVNPNDVSQILSIKVSSCCGKEQLRFAYASGNAVKVWETGGY